MILTLHTVLLTWSNLKMTAVRKQKIKALNGRQTVIRPKLRKEILSSCSSTLATGRSEVSFVFEATAIVSMNTKPHRLYNGEVSASQNIHSIWENIR